MAARDAAWCFIGVAGMEKATPPGSRFILSEDHSSTQRSVSISVEYVTKSWGQHVCYTSWILVVSAISDAVTVTPPNAASLYVYIYIDVTISGIGKGLFLLTRCHLQEVVTSARSPDVSVDRNAQDITRPTRILTRTLPRCPSRPITTN